MDVDQDTQQIESISKQEEKNRLTFIEIFNQSSKYKILFKCITQESFHGLKVKSIISLSIIIYLYNDFPMDNRSLSPKRTPRKMEKGHIEFIIKLIEENSTLSVRKLSEIIKSKFDFEVSRATIVKILKQNKYMYKQTKLKVKNEQPQQQMREN